jgi:hypothetical protein
MVVALAVNVYSSHRYLLHKKWDRVKYAQYFEMTGENDVDLDDIVLDDAVLDSKAREEVPMVTKQV